MSTRERLSKLKNEIDELLSEVEKKPELNVILNRIEQIESKFDKIGAMEELLKSKTEIEPDIRTDEILEKVDNMDSKMVNIGEEISSLKREFTDEITSLRKQVSNVIDAIIDLVKTVAPEIVKPETKVPLEPLQKIAEERILTETEELEKPHIAKPEIAPSETIPETIETTEEEMPPEEQTTTETPTILTQLEETEIPERIEEEPITEETPEVSERESLPVEEEVREEEESELDSFLSKEDETLLKELGLDMIDYKTEKKIELPDEETTPLYVQLTDLETRKLRLEREINDLKTMVQAGFGSLEDEKRLEEKIIEKEDIELKIREIEGRK